MIKLLALFIVAYLVADICYSRYQDSKPRKRAKEEPKYKRIQ